MPHPPPHVRRPPSERAGDALFDLVTRLVRAAETSGLADHLLIGFEFDGRATPGLDVRRLGGSVSSLVGWHAPPSWRGAVLVCPRAEVRAGVGVLGVAVTAYDEPLAVVSIDPRPLVPRPGPTLDTLQRVLGLPTAPPEVGAAQLGHLVWLHRVVELAVDHPCPDRLTWPELVRRWPGPFADWHSLQRAVTDRPLAVRSSARSWFDAGSYLRWLEFRLPDPADLLDTLRVLLDPGVVDRMIAAAPDPGDPPAAPGPVLA